MFLIAISTRGINNPLIVSIVSNTLISLWTLTIFEFFYTGASVKESKVVDAFLTLIST